MNQATVDAEIAMIRDEKGKKRFKAAMGELGGLFVKATDSCSAGQIVVTHRSLMGAFDSIIANH